MSIPKFMNILTLLCQLLKTPGALVVLLLSYPSLASAQVTTIPVPSLPPNARLAICGDSITEQMLYTKYVEIYLRACAGRSDVSCFQFGWGGENAAQFPNRIQRGDLDAFNPTAVTFLYGANDVGGMAWDSSWMPGMWTGRMNGVLDALASKYPSLSARVICSPTYFDSSSPGANAASINQSNTSLGYCRDICRTVAVSRGVGFSDIRQRMLQSGTAARAGAGSGYYFGGNDGVHAGTNGQFMIAHEVLKSLSCDGEIGTISVNFVGSASATTGHSIVSASGGVVVIDSTRYPFCYNYDGSTAADRMGTILPYLPFSQELNRFVLVVTNLGSASSANVTWGNTTMTFSKAELEAGVNLAAKFATTPFDSKFSSVMALIVTKQQKEQQMIKAAGDATAPTKGWTAADVTARNAMDANVASAITPVRHTITIVPAGGGAAPVVSSGSASGIVGSSFSYQVVAANQPTSFSATGLPSGLGINSTSGLISGTPTSFGTSAVSLSASNIYGTGTATLSLTIGAAQAAPVVTGALNASGTGGAPFSYQITATNNPTKYYATGLPGGLGLNSTTGAITGTPSAAGTTNVLISAENAGGNGPAVTLVITVLSPGGGGGGTDIVVDEFSTATSQYGTTLTNSTTVGGVGLAPSGVNLPGGTWKLAGGGIYDSNEYPASNPYVPGVSYATGHNGGAAAITLGSYNVSGTLTVRSSFAFSGSAAAGSYALVGFYSAPKTGQYQSLTTNFSGLKVNHDGSVQLYVNGSATGSAVAFGGSYNPAAFSTLTYNVTTNTGAISAISFGGSSASYSFSTAGFTASATAFAGFGGTMGNSPAAVVFDNFKVSTPGSTPPPAVPVLTSALTASGTVGTAFSYQITASNSPTTYVATGLPGGLSLNPATGAITGIPSAAGTTNVLLSAGNAGGTGPAVTLVITVSAAGGGGGGTDIVVDDFSTATAQWGTTLTSPNTVGGVGLTPSGVNLPGGTWQLAGGGIYDSNEYPASNPYVPGVSYATGHNGGAAAISLGSYNLNRELTVRSSFLFSGSAAAGSCALVGFYSAPKATQYQSLTANFSGVKVNYDGSLQLYINGVTSGGAVAYGGSYNPLVFALLTFTVNTSTGAISGVSLGGSSATYSFSSTGFGNSATAYAGFGGTMGNSPAAVVFDTFKVSAP